MIGTILFVTFLVLLVIGAPIALCLGAATCAAIGSIMVPAMIEAGYDKRFALASVAVPGVLGCIIPPSTVMISYSSVTDASVGSMFMGGILPGILMGVAMMIVAVKYGISHKDVKRTPFSLKNLLQKFVKAIGALLASAVFTEEFLLRLRQQVLPVHMD